MGYHNAVAALMARDVSMTARNALLVMALTALDDDAAHTGVPLLYWAGWAHLALGLGYTKYDNTAKQRVKQAVRELVDTGYVQPLHHHPSGNRVYRLHLPNSPPG